MLKKKKTIRKEKTGIYKLCKQKKRKKRKKKDMSSV